MAGLKSSIACTPIPSRCLQQIKRLLLASLPMPNLLCSHVCLGFRAGGSGAEENRRLVEALGRSPFAGPTPPKHRPAQSVADKYTMRCAAWPHCDHAWRMHQGTKHAHDSPCIIFIHCLVAVHKSQWSTHPPKLVHNVCHVCAVFVV